MEWRCESCQVALVIVEMIVVKVGMEVVVMMAEVVMVMMVEVVMVMMVGWVRCILLR